MKRLLVCLLFLCLCPVICQGEGVVRLHILAQSDSQADQALKLAVKDHVLAAIAGRGEGDLFASLHRELPRIRQAARRAGFEGKVTLQTGWFHFDERELNGHVYPAGYYPAARILLGEGNGQNWWGLLNPDLTLAAAGDGEVQWYLPHIFSLWLMAS